MALYSYAVHSFKVQMLFASAVDDRPRREWRDGNDGPAGRVRGRGMLADVAAAHGIITRPCRRAGASVFSAGVLLFLELLLSYFPPCALLLFVSVLLVVVLCIYRLPRESAHSSPTSHHITASPHRPGLPAPAYANAAHPSCECFCHTRVPALGAVLLLSARLISPTLHRVTRPTCARSGSCSRCRRASQH
jgi:hypothetical protein